MNTKHYFGAQNGQRKLSTRLAWRATRQNLRPVKCNTGIGKWLKYSTECRNCESFGKCRIIKRFIHQSAFTTLQVWEILDSMFFFTSGLCSKIQYSCHSLAKLSWQRSTRVVNLCILIFNNTLAEMYCSQQQSSMNEDRKTTDTTQERTL